MEISIKNDDTIEELADAILSLNGLTTNTTEIKASIINLINDKLYQHITNISLSTIIKNQLPSETKSNSPVKTEPKKNNNKVKTDSSSDNVVNETPENIFPPTMPTDVNEIDPATQYHNNQPATSGTLTYDHTKYNYETTVMKAGPFKGQTKIVVQYQLPETINQKFADKDNQAKLTEIIKQLNAKYQGQTPTYYNQHHSLLFTIADEKTLNDYVNDLDSVKLEVEKF